MTSKKGRQKGKALQISGLPLSGTISQVENPSVEPNRDESTIAFRENREIDDAYMHDYFRDERERLGETLEDYVPKKGSDAWSVGLQDEANQPEPENFASEDALPEIQPLHLDVRTTNRDKIEDSADTWLRQNSRARHKSEPNESQTDRDNREAES